MNYKISKIGLLNFWYFDDEVFNFFDGKLLLRGENGSGKSVTMQSFIPLILDGNKAPNRLDPFGSKEKRIENYVLGPQDGEQKEDATSYLYMETYNEEKDKYITVGIGLHSRRGKGTDFWGFALKDGRRIGIDFNLYKDYTQKIPLTKNELRARLTDANEFTDSTKEYKKIVNSLLFGFDDLDAYDEFINVLLQLRSSKLSRDYTPSKLVEILSSVLKPLTEEDLHSLSEAIEDTNKTKEKIELLDGQVKSVKNFLKTYQNYNETILYGKALNVDEIESEIKLINSDKLKLVKELSDSTNRLNEIENELLSLIKEEEEIKTKKEAINSNDLIKQAENLSKIIEEINEIKQSIKLLIEKQNKLNEKEIDIKNGIDDINEKIYKDEKELKSIAEDITVILENIKLNDVATEINKLIKNKEINFDYIENRINTYENKINAIKLKLEEKEKIENYLNEKQEEYNKENKKLQYQEEMLKKEERNLIDEKDNLKDSINLLNNNNEIVHLEKEERNAIFDLIDNYSSTSYKKASDIYTNIASYYKEKELEKKNILKNKRQKEDEKLSLLKEELDKLKNGEDLEYEECEEELNTNRTLDEKKINYIPFYKAVEFKNEISEEVKNKLEEQLISSGIINAKLISKNNKVKVRNLKSNFLFESIKKKDNILQYLNVVENDKLSSDEIKNILSCISINKDDDIYVNEEEYKFDFLTGYSTGNYESKYIGALKRLEIKRKLITEKEKEIETLTGIINNFDTLIQKTNEKIEKINEEKNMFPQDETLAKVLEQIKSINTTIKILSENSKNLIDLISRTNIEIENIIKDINEMKDNILIPINLASFKEALGNIKVLNKELSNLKIYYSRITNYEDTKKSKEEILAEVTTDIGEKTGEITSKNTELNKLESRKKALDEIISKDENKHLLEEIKNITERLNEIPSIKDALNKEEGKTEAEKERITKELENIDQIITEKETELELKKDILIDEYNLGYVYKDNNCKVSKILTDLKERKNSDLNNALNNLFTSFNDYRQVLGEYHLNTKEIFGENSTKIAHYTEKQMNENTVTKILNGAKRYILVAVYQGKNIDIYELEQNLCDAIEESQNYITIQERHLFEDILLKTVGKKIRNHIESSKKWVEMMNRIMKETQIDSNLSFELEWRSKEAYTEEELDTKEIVRLFQIDSSLIKKEESEKLFNHFNSKINRELSLSEDERLSYSEVISNVLDYRNWFEFKLYYRRKTGDKKELTNKVFFILSGGERAKSMYVPLFAAVYAKLMSASSTALRIIALDEAFAGVDEINIREMFSILSQLNLDYILTSQALWGDYDTVKSLSICELIKDETLATVGVRRYKWNGEVKEILV